MDTLARLLSTSSGVLPRRAVLVDGKLGEKSGDPQEQDLDFVSNACDVIREERGEPSYPRTGHSLFHMCLNSDDPEAWRCMARDMDIGVFSMRDETDDCYLYWKRLTEAKTIGHLSHIVKCGSAIPWSDEGKKLHRSIFEIQYGRIIDTVLETCKYEFSTITAELVSRMQGLLAVVDPEDTTDAISYVIDKNAPSFLAMFEKCRIRPECVKILLPALAATPIPETAIFVLLSKASIGNRHVLFEHDGPAILTKAVSVLLSQPDIDKKTATVVMCLCKQLFMSGSLASHVTTLALAVSCNAPN